jgi:hypothetical protein
MQIITMAKDSKDTKKSKNKPAEKPVTTSPEKKKRKTKDDAKALVAISDTQGLNIPVPKVKRSIGDNIINHRETAALNELKEHRVMDEVKDDNKEPAKLGKAAKRGFTFVLKGLSKPTLDLIKEGHQNAVHLQKQAFSSVKIKSWHDDDEKKYNAYREARNKAEKKYENGLLVIGDGNFDAVAFNAQYDKHFFKDFSYSYAPGKVLANEDYTKLKNIELYEYCTSVINKLKTRFNSDSKVIITAGLELLTRDILRNAARNCVDAKKKILKVDHALNLNGDESNFPLHRLLPTLDTYVRYKALLKEAEKKSDSDSETKEDEETEKVRVPYKHYIGEAAKVVKRELVGNDCDSPFAKFNISADLKLFISDVISELCVRFGHAMLSEVQTRKIKTVNNEIARTIIYQLYINAGAYQHLKGAEEFIRSCYNRYREFIALRAKQNQDKKATLANE